MMLVNQIIAQIKIQEVWKAWKEEKYPVSIKRQTTNSFMTSTRASTSGRLIELGKCLVSQKSSINRWFSSRSRVYSSLVIPNK